MGNGENRDGPGGNKSHNTSFVVGVIVGIVSFLAGAFLTHECGCPNEASTSLNLAQMLTQQHS